VNLVNELLLRLMKKAGCNFIKVGIESGSERVLKGMNKRITHEQVRQAAKLFRKVGIYWTGYFMMGVPGETEEDIRKTIDFLYEVKPNFACIGVYEPFPGTVMFQEGIRRGLVKPKMTLEDFYATLPNHYYKKDPQRQTDLIAPERFVELEAEVKDIVYHYNRSVLRVAKMAHARSRVYCNDPKVLWDDFKKFLSY
jgi:anaerobic magnesium-protoporphyrin IX monomethyl ester cyclase